MGAVQSPSASAAAIVLTGHERFGWTQRVDDLTGYQFAMYVDGVRIELPHASCQPPVSGQAECVTPLPPIARGRHIVEIVSWTRKDGRVVESARSSSMTIDITGGAGAAATPKAR
jgi:hypothetical protein